MICEKCGKWFVGDGSYCVVCHDKLHHQKPPKKKDIDDEFRELFEKAYQRGFGAGYAQGFEAGRAQGKIEQPVYIPYQNPEGTPVNPTPPYIVTTATAKG